MRYFRSLTLLSSSHDAVSMARTLAAGCRMMKTMRDWFQNPSWPFRFTSGIGTLEGIRDDGEYAFRLKSREDGHVESLHVKDGMAITELYVNTRGQEWNPAKRPLLLESLLAVPSFLADEKPFMHRDMRPLEVDEVLAEEVSHLLLDRTPSLAMPVVYMSVSYATGNPLIDPARIQGLLQGQAHVAYEKDPKTTNAMRAAFGGSGNPYNGSVMIRMPDGRSRLFRLDAYSDMEKAEVLLARALQQMTATLKTASRRTFDAMNRRMVGAENAALKENEQRLSDLVEELKRSVDDRPGDLDGLFDQLTARLDETERRCALLQAEAERWKAVAENAKKDAQGRIRLSCSEDDLYPDEAKDAILTVLSRHLETMANGDPDFRKKRLYTILQAVVDGNARTGEGDRLLKEIEDAISSQTRLDDRTLSTLARLGLSLTAEGTHYKMNLFSDPRYVVMLSKTPSDIRTRRNEVETIKRMYFL